MKVLVINSGSSSLKYQLIVTSSPKKNENGKNSAQSSSAVLCKGTFERIGEDGAFYEHKVDDGELQTALFACATHADAVKKMIELVSAVSSLDTLDAIGHRVVHGGEVFKESTLATEKTVNEVEKLSVLAPLHNPANVVGLRACMKLLPKVPNVMVFDTAFHSSMPKEAFLYGLPVSDYTDLKIRRYGFHGTSHNFVARKAAEMAGADISTLKVITCHIGNGCSVTAVDGGKSVDTSMGMTPLEGLVMGTRSGDIDPAVIEVLCNAHKMSVSECITYLNKKSGLLGLSGTGSDMRDLMNRRTGDEKAQTAIDCFVHRTVKYIGAYAAVMNGVDIIVWTGGIGNNNEYIRAQVMKHFGYLGAVIDPAKNDKLNGMLGGKNLTSDISAPKSKVRTFVICTNEELEIATETEKVIQKK